MSQTWWEDYTEIVDARLRHSNSCVLLLRVNGKQFKSIPRVVADRYGIKIQVLTNYTPASQNPTTGVWTVASYATTGPGTSGGAWDGTFKTVWSSNPAWVFYDAAVKVRYGAGSFPQRPGLDKWTLYAIAQWCDAMVADGKGGNEPRMVCNLYMQNSVNAIKAPSSWPPSSGGRVLRERRGLSGCGYRCSPSALFTNANGWMAGSATRARPGQLGTRRPSARSSIPSSAGPRTRLFMRTWPGLPGMATTRWT